MLMDESYEIMKSSFPAGDVQRLWGFFEYRLYPGAKMDSGMGY